MDFDESEDATDGLNETHDVGGTLHPGMGDDETAENVGGPEPAEFTVHGPNGSKQYADGDGLIRIF